MLFPAGLLAAAAPAQQSPTPATALPTEPEVVLAPLIITGATSERPLSVTLDPKAPAQPIPAQDGADVLKAAPGFSVIRKGGTDGDPVLRGMAGSRLVVALDDQVVLGGCGNRMDPPTAYVFPAAYDRVTILKGPQTVLHGPGNSAGVVLFESERTRREKAGFGGSASATIATFGRRDAAVDLRGGTPAFVAHAAMTRTEGGDYRDGDGRRVHAAHERWSARASLGWTPDAQTLVEISGTRSDGEAAYADRMMDGVVFDRENLALRVRREQVTPLVASLELQVGYNAIDHVMDNYSLRDFAPSMMMPNPAVSNPDRTTTGGRLVAELTPADHLTRLTLGVDQQSNRHGIRSSNNQPASPYQTRPYLRDADFSQWGLFGEVSRDLGDTDRIIVGGRIDDWQATDHRERVAISMMATVANPSHRHVRESRLASGFARYEHRLASVPATFYAGLGHVSRFPDYWELIKNESASSVTAFGTRPEKTTQLDVGTHATFGTVDLAVAVFANQVRDFNLVQSGYGKPAGMMGTRLAVVTRTIDASTWGGEISAGWRFAERWRAEASVAGTRGSNDADDRPLAQIPPLEARFALAYARATWTVGGLVRAVAAQDRVAVNQGNIVGQDIGPSPGFAVVSAHASWRATRSLRVSLGADNLFDSSYAEHVSRAGGLLAGYPQTTRVNEPGRVLWSRVDLSF